MSKYRINEIFLSPQGEGARQGDLSVFIRFTGCNLRCDIEPGPRSPGGFACDTEFMSGVRMSALEIVQRADELWGEQAVEPWVVLTGGEPLLQVDAALVDLLHERGWKIQIETNGTRAVPDEWGIDWLTVSPKVAEHALRQLKAHEVKYVRGFGQGLPKTRIQAMRRFISPAFDGNEPNPETLDWCERLCTGDSEWEVSVQMHKVWGVR